LLASGEQCGAILHRPRVVLRVRELEAIGAELYREVAQFRNAHDVVTMQHDVEGEWDAGVANERGGDELAIEASHAGDQFGAFAFAVLKAQLNMVETAFAKLAELVLVQSCSAGNQVDVKATVATDADESRQIRAQQRLAA